ncbi:MAG: diacylglycerol kinase [Candidatus Omnitrophica bacterium]|nr:diacylglycerol kinase [Candidatus Omnitrophota bacterium]
MKKPGSKKYNATFWDSVNNALQGIIHTFQNERNMRIHLLAASAVVVLAVFFDLHYMEFILLLFAITFVLITEMINTAVEHLSDTIVKEEFHPLIKLAKDVAAGSVVVASVNAIVTGYILTVNKIATHKGHLFFKITGSSWHVTFIILLVCFGLVVLVKHFQGAKNLLQGGMPSGHTALAFAVWMVVWIFTQSSLASVLVFVLALVIARSRVREGFHSAWEVFIGGVLGSLTALFIYQLLS